MDSQQLALYERIEAFRFDEPGASLTFIQRLARDHRWSLEYAWRVVIEYKRFAFLAVAAGHPVTPSEDVDEAWHLHLVYTKSYWDEFCPNVLGKQLHHHPTTGGESERDKHIDWYANTLASYEKIFGPAPADIWPPATERFSAKHHHVQIDRANYWIIRKPHWPGVAKIALLVVGVLSLGAAPLMGEGLNPLDLKGGSFLALYLALFFVAVIAVSTLRWCLRSPGEGELDPPDGSSLHPYEIAWLAGGQVRAFDAAVTHLVTRGNLKYDSVQRCLEHQSKLSEKSHPFDKSIMAAVNVDGSIAVVRAAMKAEPRAWVDRLREQGLLLTNSQASLARWIPTLVPLVLTLLGIAKISVGLSRNKPVGFLILLTLAAAIATVVVAAVSSHRTRFGDRVLKQWAKRHLSLKKPDWNAAGSIDSAAIAVALYSSSVLASSPWRGIEEELTPSRPWSGSGCGGGCGGGGCGGCGGCGG
jgi:uncharacterized protein (TIGR04222 family)